jgi:methionine synthase II (cobalamin-independent)
VASKKIETPKEVFNLIKKITKYVSPKKLTCCTNCGDDYASSKNCPSQNGVYYKRK